MQNQKSCLIVDDSALSRMMIAKHIRASKPDWRIVEAGSGEEALALVGECAPDMVTMDVNMAGMSGFEAAEQIKALCPQTHIVLLTANIQESSRRKAEELGIGFVRKPVTEASIAQAIEKLLGLDR